MDPSSEIGKWLYLSFGLTVEDRIIEDLMSILPFSEEFWFKFPTIWLSYIFIQFRLFHLHFGPSIDLETTTCKSFYSSISREFSCAHQIFSFV